jgi:hypothetical protein
MGGLMECWGMDLDLNLSFLSTKKSIPTNLGDVFHDSGQARIVH